MRPEQQLETGVSLNPSRSIFPRDTNIQALGINCRGSIQCGDCSNIGRIASLVYHIADDAQYGNNQQIACSGCFWWQSTFALCIFPQNIGDRKISGKLIKDKLGALIAHNCYTCGSIPTEDNVPDNNVNNGELTVNYVLNGCNAAYKDKIC
ncbi:killer toxin Kp4/SMK [Lophiotrema nucula]|uniref:Killer toxin Kp4/SMK n=1 Tax=Lophiotrema nucula TaxID=690887 RepID=A0A6A5ZMZ9_9PLEO|nr:killer toxin Kp4/SMK [Lophiotrema nucula]